MLAASSTNYHDYGCMAIEVTPLNVLSGGLVIPSSFTDPLDNSFGANPNNTTFNNFNWYFTLLGLGTPLANPPQVNGAYLFGQPLSGGGGTGMTTGITQFGANPPYFITNGIIPIRLLPAFNDLSIGSAFYIAKKKFVQFTFNALGANNAAGVGLINFEDLSGAGAGGNSQIDHDAYILRCDGFLIRYNSGSANSVLQGGIAFAQGDIWRIGFDASNAAQTVIILKKNGVTQFTITDNNANRLTGNAFPVICCIASSVGVWQFEIKNFSCGLGA